MKKKIISITLTLILTCAIFFKIGYCTEYNYTLIAESTESQTISSAKNFTFNNITGRISVGTTSIGTQTTDTSIIGKNICFKALFTNDNTTTNYFCVDNIESGKTYNYSSEWGTSIQNKTIKLQIYEKIEVIEEPPIEEPQEPQEPSKEDFLKAMYIGLVEIGTLIFMLFFKWCFPMKGAKKNGK